MAAHNRNGTRKAQGSGAEAQPLDRVAARMAAAQYVLDGLLKLQRAAQAGAPGPAQDALLTKLERQVARLEAEMRRP